MSIESTRAVMMQYWSAHDVSKVDEHAVYTIMGTGEETRGREAIEQMLHYFYHVVFEARDEVKHMLFADGQACLEADFVGRQLREFAGVVPTGKEVHIPLCVVYDLEHDLITRGRIYIELDALRQQSTAL